MIVRFAMFFTKLGPCAWEGTIQWDAHAITFYEPSPLDIALKAMSRTCVDSSGEGLLALRDKAEDLSYRLHMSQAELFGLISFIEEVRIELDRVVDKAGDINDFREAARKLRALLRPWPPKTFQ